MSEEHDREIEAQTVPSDPLSPATRSIKRNLLVASLVAVTFKAFKISVEHISVAGLNMDFDRGVFEFLILVSLLYFLATFALYYYIDIRNLRKTDHQVRTDVWERARLSEFKLRYYEQTAQIARQPKMPRHTSVTLNNNYLYLLDRYLEPPAYPSSLDTLKELGAVPAGLDDKIDYLTVGITSTKGQLHQEVEKERREATEAVDAIALRRASEFPRKYRRFRARLLPRIATVRAAYIVRNYGTDGILPIVFALFALATLYNLFDVSQLPNLLPNDARSVE